MADNKKYYYMRLKENFFESEELVMLESMPEGMLYSNILIKLYLKSLKNEGRLMFKDTIPYNAQMIATITRHQIGTVEKALTIFRDLELIEVLDNGTIYMNDIELFIGKASTEAERKKRARMAIEAEKKILIEQTSDKCPNENGQMSDKLPPENREQSLETRVKRTEIINNSEDVVGQSVSPVTDIQFLKLKDFFSQSIREPKNTDLAKLNEALDFYEPALILEAIKTAKEMRGRSFAYVIGILDNWRKDDGVKTYADWQVKISGSNAASNTKNTREVPKIITRRSSNE
ncbi:gp45 [Lysinibacillus capsici]|uniref:Gp45 n=1 Tax=Lysinibacillus capsici TaxID=2115968 RepID=A0A2X0Z744_9BACI|nr:phage replisome organizer N-terminal domain-containing protein [Lysinibacillus capsici]SPT98371.1 gp45 [Lysinibacillus capsici]